MYNLSFFRIKFFAIPDELWITNTYGSYEAHCAFGHCGARGTDADFSGGSEADFLDKLFIKYGMNVVDINDRNDDRYQQPLPKQRILAALDDIEQQQAVEQAQAIINQPKEMEVV